MINLDDNEHMTHKLIYNLSNKLLLSGLSSMLVSESESDEPSYICSTS